MTTATTQPQRSAPLILASASPRRRELLAALRLPFTVQASAVPEPLLVGVPATDQAVQLALVKARAVAAGRRTARVLGADTIVVLDGEPLGKPLEAADAAEMLRRLCGRPHQVVTGVALLSTDGREQTAAVSTTVVMRSYTDAEIAAYIATGDPFDKAGGYAIQHPQFAPVARIDGCYCNVVGLPLWTVRRLLVTGLPPSTALDRCAACPEREEVTEKQRLPQA